MGKLELLHKNFTGGFFNHSLSYAKAIKKKAANGTANWKAGGASTQVWKPQRTTKKLSRLMRTESSTSRRLSLRQGLRSQPWRSRS